MNKKWFEVLIAWLISVLLQLISKTIGMTGDASFFTMVLNGTIIWGVLSLLFFVAQFLSFVIFSHKMKLTDAKSFYLSRLADMLLIISSGMIFMKTMSLTSTPTPWSWWWYCIFGAVHCIRAGQLRNALVRD